MLPNADGGNFAEIAFPRSPLRQSSLVKLAIAFAALTGIPLAFLCTDSGLMREVVKFRLPKEKTVHLNDEATAKSYAKSLKKLGCDHRVAGHAGHFDVTMHCPVWRTAEFGDCHAATKWQTWLTTLEFEVQRQH